MAELLTKSTVRTAIPLPGGARSGGAAMRTWHRKCSAPGANGRPAQCPAVRRIAVALWDASATVRREAAEAPTACGAPAVVQSGAGRPSVILGTCPQGAPSPL